MEANRDLKHLNFVQTSSQRAFAAAVPTVESAYKIAKAYVPSVVHPEIAKVEETVSRNVAPLAAKASDAADRLLHYADDQVNRNFVKYDFCNQRV